MNGEPPFPRKASGRAAKRALDVALSALLLVASAPLLAVLVVLVRLASGPPVFYRQTRLGRGGAPFSLWKIRTMVPDAEAGTGPVVGGSDDPRQTRIGRLLRRSGLDELPQLVQVLTGEMSLVGPRPERPAVMDRVLPEIPGYARRLRAKPGVTGLAQVAGLRGRTDFRRRLVLDRAYIRRWSILLDLGILLRTPLALLRRPVESEDAPLPAAAGIPDAPGGISR